VSRVAVSRPACGLVRRPARRLPVERKLTEESHDLAGRMGTAKIGVRTARVPARPRVTQPVHEPLLGARNAFGIAIGRDAYRRDRSLHRRRESTQRAECRRARQAAAASLRQSGHCCADARCRRHRRERRSAARRAARRHRTASPADAPCPCRRHRAECESGSSATP